MYVCMYIYGQNIAYSKRHAPRIDREREEDTSIFIFQFFFFFFFKNQEV